MKKHYYDAMSMVAMLGKPEFLITFTMSPFCEEIQKNIDKNDHYVNRPDITTRVYWCKFQKFQDELFKDHVLGLVKAYVWVTEFQKRGLPHAHLLLWLDDRDKIKSANQLDQFIWAFIPEKDKDPELHKLVLDHMIHGPCIPYFRCMTRDPKKCSKKYPKPLIEQTIIQDNGYPFYYRPDTGKVYNKGSFIFDNRHVIPYNPYLLKRFGSHINIEYVATVDCVKYLFKYVFKGNDQAIVNIIASANEPGNSVTVKDSVKEASNLLKNQERLDENECESDSEYKRNVEEVPPLDYDECKNHTGTFYLIINLFYNSKL